MISVAMATYNGEKYIREQLESILQQTRQVDEIIICDDGSTDSTVQVIEEFKDNRIHLFRNTDNVGYVENFYQAIAKTKGDYIFLADQDDIWEPDKVQQMIDKMEERKCQLLCTNFTLMDGQSREITDRSQFQMSTFLKRLKNEMTPIRFHRLAFGNIVQGCTYCITAKVREVYLKVHHTTLIHDHQLMFVAAALGDVFLYDKPFIRYRIHEKNSVGFQKKEREWILKNKKPDKKPFMVRFMEELNAVVPVKRLWYYKFLFYCRIPYLVAVFRKAVFGE